MLDNACARLLLVAGLLLLFLWRPVDAKDTGVPCADLRHSEGALAVPSSCVADGEPLIIELTAFSPGQLVSVVVVDAQSPVGGGDIALRVGEASRLVIDPRDFRGHRIPMNHYRVWIKDVTGRSVPAFVDARFGHGGAMVAPPATATMVSVPTTTSTPSVVGDATSVGPAPPLGATAAPATQAVLPPVTPTPSPTPTTTFEIGCDLSYPTICILPPPPQLTCEEIGLNDFVVAPPDSHNLDPDGNGIGCESDAEQRVP